MSGFNSSAPACRVVRVVGRVFKFVFKKHKSSRDLFPFRRFFRGRSVGNFSRISLATTSAVCARVKENCILLQTNIHKLDATWKQTCRSVVVKFYFPHMYGLLSRDHHCQRGRERRWLHICSICVILIQLMLLLLVLLLSGWR